MSKSQYPLNISSVCNKEHGGPVTTSLHPVRELITINTGHKTVITITQNLLKVSIHDKHGTKAILGSMSISHAICNIRSSFLKKSTLQMHAVAFL